MVYFLQDILIVVAFTYSVLVWLLRSRKERGKNLSANPRRFEKLVLWRISKKYRIHIHHGYWAVVPIVIRSFFGDYCNFLAITSAVLVFSDVVFHFFAHRYLGDPRWDFIIDNNGETVFWK